jgi:hypothetical protein
MMVSNVVAALPGLVAEGVGLVGVGQAVHQKKEADSRAKEARKAADATATAEQEIASNQAARAVREEAEAHTENVIKGAELAGQFSNAQNKSDVQMAAYMRQATRATQADQNARDLRVAAISGSKRDAFQRTQVNRTATYSTIRGGSKLGLALGLAGAGIAGQQEALRHR